MAKSVPVVAAVKDGTKEVSLDAILRQHEDSMDAKLRSIERKFKERLESMEKRLGSCWQFPPNPAQQLGDEPETLEIIDLPVDKLEKGFCQGEAGLQNFPGQTQTEEAFISAVPQLCESNSQKHQDDAVILGEVNSKCRTCSVEDFAETVEFTFDESIWDCAIFIGCTPMGPAGSCFMFVLLLVNIGMQVLYSSIVETAFTTSNFNNQTVQGYERFRYQVAHDSRYLDHASFSSLAARICGGDASVEMAGQQGDAVSIINKYLPEEKYGDSAVFGNCQGQVMCVVSLLVWCFVVAQELRKLLDTIKAFVYLSRHRPGNPTEFVEQDGVYRLATLCPLRFSIAIIVVLIRFGIASVLCFAGVRYLIYTINLRDLVLNAVALQCVLDVDEIMYAALAPLPVRAFMSALQPVEVPAYSSWKGLDLPACFFFVGIAATIVVSVPVWLFPEVHRLGLARDALCGGEKDFVVTTTNYPPFLSWSNSTPLSQTRGASLNFNSMAAKTIVMAQDTKWVNDIRMGSIVGGAWSLKALSMWSVPAASLRFNPICRDLEEVALSPELIEVYKTVLSEALGVEVKTCNQSAVLARCNVDCRAGAMVRTICPVTCGCDSPFSSLLLTHPASGCPPSCAQGTGYKDAVRITACNEDPPEDLIRFPRWVDYAHAVPKIAVAANWPKFVIEILSFLGQLMLERGCDAIPEFYRQTAIDMCDESEVRRLPLASLRLMCPKTCNCAFREVDDRFNCPTACFPS